MFNKHFWLYVTVSLLVTSGTLALIPTAKAQTPAVFIDPSQVVGDLTPAPGAITQWKVNVSDIVDPGLCGYEFSLAMDPQAFPEHRPITNGNFTASASGWTPIPEITRGTATYGYYANDGNPTPGSGPGSYRMRANATGGGQTASMYIALEQTFNWGVGTPVDFGAIVSFAYTISGNSFGTTSAGFVSVSIRVIKPDGTTIATLIPTKNFITAKSWSYNVTAANTAALDQVGTYKFQIRSRLITAGTATSDYLEIKWDDIGLMLAPVSASSQGTFLTSDSRNVGHIYWSAKYLKFPTNNSLYVSASIMGTPYVDVWPVQGSGMLANITLQVEYGAANLDLWGTILAEIGLPPSYPPIPIDHTTADGWLDNRITGDANGDKTVNVFDILAVKSRWGRTPASPDWVRQYDVNNDSAINVFDILTVKANWGRTTP